MVWGLIFEAVAVQVALHKFRKRFALRVFMCVWRVRGVCVACAWRMRVTCVCVCVCVCVLGSVLIFEAVAVQVALYEL